MKYINDPLELRTEFKRLMNTYKNYHWMVAWAGDMFELTNELLKKADRIKQLIVGLHFYQTHPKFIQAFYLNPSVKFIQTTSGIFHSKVYFFSNNPEDWELLIGSANFTNSAFNYNNEANLLIKSDTNNGYIYKELMNSINNNWLQAKKFTDEDLYDYKISFANQKSKIDSLSGYKRDREHKQIYKLPVVKRSWSEYINEIYNATDELVIQERLRLLDIVKKHFINYPVFEDMPPEARKQVGGYVQKNQEVNFRLFGNMQNATTFTHLVNTNPLPISKALDEIPFTGNVTKVQYDAFVAKFNVALSGGNKYRSATRLLAMKRPDIFFGLSNGNNIRLSQDFNITSVNTINLDRYWDEIILKVYESDWWQNAKPINVTERRISDYRVAFMDAMYYVPASK